MDSLTGHYDKEYYSSHYGAFLDDQRYVEAIAHFYNHTIFDPLKLGPADKILDFGSGPGQLTHRIAADCYDPSDYIQALLRQQKRIVYGNVADIPRGAYRAVFSSHSLEHCLSPADELKGISSYLQKNGLLVLLLPKETVPGRPMPGLDNNRHFYAWNFQLLTNLLCALGFEIVTQRVFHAPYGLRTLTKRLPMETAVIWSHRLGQWLQNYPALLTVARKTE